MLFLPLHPHQARWQAVERGLTTPHWPDKATPLLEFFHDHVAGSRKGWCECKGWCVSGGGQGGNELQQGKRGSGVKRKRTEGNETGSNEEVSGTVLGVGLL